MQALKLAVNSRKTDRTMEEDVEPDEEEESTFADECLWSTVLGTSTAEASKPAALSLSALLCAPPHWSKCEGRGRESKGIRVSQSPPKPDEIASIRICRFCSKS